MWVAKEILPRTLDVGQLMGGYFFPIPLSLATR